MTWDEAGLVVSRLHTYYAANERDEPLRGTVKGRALTFISRMDDLAPPSSVYPTAEGTIEFFWELPGGVYHRVEITGHDLAETMTTFPEPTQSAVFGAFNWRSQQESSSD